MNPAVRACECFCCAQNSLPHGSPSPCVVSRLEFEQQLDELMEKHKTLQECHSMEKLAAEICSMAESRERLLSEDKLIQDNLAQVEKQLDSLPQAEAAPSQERMFLKSQEASSALCSNRKTRERPNIWRQLRAATQNCSRSSRG
ncbi:synaptonemal complex central element protein 1-like isoform X4 [Eretmochelys imbricata]